MIAKPARSLEKFIPLFDKQEKKVVLDYGSGNLRNSMYLHRRGYEVFAVDLPHRVKTKGLPRLTCILPEEIMTINDNIDITLCTFVLNLIPPEERAGFINTISSKMSPGGFLLVETKGLSLYQLDTLIIPKGFVRVYNDNGRYTVIVLYRFIGPLP